MGGRRGIGGTGTAQHWERILPVVRPALLALAEERPAKNVGPGRGRPIKIPDETVIAIRRMSEIDRKPFKEVCHAFQEIRPATIKQFIDYVTRVNLRI